MQEERGCEGNASIQSCRREHGGQSRLNIGLVCLQRQRMAYKEKTCPKCGVKHNKRGEYCSRSCGNKKKHNENTKLAIATTQSIRMRSDDPVAEEQRYALAKVNGALDPVSPPTVSRVGTNQFVSDGDLWTEV